MEQNSAPVDMVNIPLFTGFCKFCTCQVVSRISSINSTLPETNIARENGWLEYNFPIGMAYFQVLC